MRRNTRLSTHDATSTHDAPSRFHGPETVKPVQVPLYRAGKVSSYLLYPHPRHPVAEF